MPGRAKMTLLAGVCAAAIAGCGGSSDESTEIPTEPGERLLQRLDELEQQVDSGDCSSDDDGAEAQAAEVRRIIEQDLPADFDPEVQEGLLAAADNLADLTAAECIEGQGRTPEERDSTSTDEEEPTTSTTTTTTQTTTTETSTTTQDEEEPPPDNEQPGGNPGGQPQPQPDPGGNPGNGNPPPDVDVGPSVPPSGGVGADRRAP